MSKQIGRNDPCPCGSGKKYKACCWRKNQGGPRPIKAKLLTGNVDLMKRAFGGAAAEPRSLGEHKIGQGPVEKTADES